MARYLGMWEMDQNRIPEDPKTRVAAWLELISMVNKDMERGILKDWGVIPGQMSGYSILEGSEADLYLTVQQYTPWVKFTIHPIMNVGEVEKMLHILSEN